jgi:putative ABC transport system substrate-binding protein
VGFLCWVTCGDAYHEAFWQALRKLGYADYRNITFEYRAAGGDGESLDTLAVQLINLRPAVIVADTTQSARALKEATRTIPLVVIADDPVGSGFVSNLARPGGNVTGLSSMTPELGAKQLQLLKDAVPVIARVAVLENPSNPATALQLRAMQVAAGETGVTLVPLDVRSPPEHERAFAAIAQMHADALIDARHMLDCLTLLSSLNNMFCEYRPHGFGLSLRVDHSSGLNGLPCFIESTDQNLDFIRLKPRWILCEKITQFIAAYWRR